ncbi:phage tail protein [Pseudomonas baltica]|uniref:phage tail protein n=1 Tax=Pseudomonas baltica TaxID=2762576 RepID=UPI00289D8F19|nr:phage tail protein [Pseudomonas baltica]
MTDQTSQFYAILTNIGLAKQANADALGIGWKITQMGVGDANGTEPMPAATQTKLINEVRRAPLNQLKVDPNNSAIIVAEQVIPAEVGGFWIRELALYDDAGDMVAVANCPPSFKPLLTQGSGRTQTVRMNLIVSNTSSVELKIDPSVVLATRAYVDQAVATELSKQDYKQSVRAVATANIVLSGLQTVDGVVVVAGDRVLVPTQNTGKDNGLYVAAAGPWSRATDADISAEVTPGVLVVVEEGDAYADSIWQLTTNAPITLGATALVFELLVGKQASQSEAIAGINASKTMTALRVAQAIQVSAGILAVDTGAAGAYVGLYSPAITELKDQMVVRLKASNPNPGAATFKVNALAPAPIVDLTHSVLQGGEIAANGELVLQWNSAIGTGSWVLLSNAGGAPLSAPAGIGPSARIRNITIVGATISGWVDDWVIVGVANSSKTWKIPNFSAQLSLSKTGIGGLDTGSATANGFLLVYAAYNPVTKAYGVFGQMESAGTVGTVGAPATYQGANLPAGYTATALIGIAPVGSTPTTFGAFTQVGRRVRLAQSAIVSLSAIPTSQSWQTVASASIPFGALSVDGFLSMTSNYSSGPMTLQGGIAAVAGGSATQILLTSSSGLCSNNNSFADLPIHTPRTIAYFFFNSVSTTAAILAAAILTGFTF